MDRNTERIKPYEGSEPYLFVSYAHRDYDRVYPILRELAARGYRFWYDEGIDPGTEWPESIARHLENSSVCLSFLSSNAAASKNCRREINFALSRNIPLLTVFLEDTKVSPGLEMQISTYQSIMGYRYPDLPSLMERFGSVDVTAPCRGTAGVSAAAGESAGHTASAAPKKRWAWVAIAAALVLGAGVAVALWPKDRGVPAEAPGVVLKSTEEPTEEATEETVPMSPAAAIQTPGPVPEGYSVIFHGTWDDGEILLWGDGDKNVRIELTDDRIPYGFPMSEQPGNNDPNWAVSLCVAEGYTLHFYLSARDSLSSLSNLHTEKQLTMFTVTKDLGGFRYTLTGNTFCFESRLPEDFSVQDIDLIYVLTGKENGDAAEYFFLVDEGLMETP